MSVGAICHRDHGEAGRPTANDGVLRSPIEGSGISNYRRRGIVPRTCSAHWGRAELQRSVGRRFQASQNELEIR